MTKSIVNPLLDSTIQQLTAIRNILGDTTSGMLIDAAKAQLTAVKATLNGVFVPMLPQGEQKRDYLNNLGINRDKPNPQMRLDEIAPKEKKTRKITKKGTADKRGGNMRNRDVWNKEDFAAAILIVLREAPFPLQHAEITKAVARRQGEFNLDGDMPAIGARDCLAYLESQGSITRAGEGRPARWEVV